MNNTKAQKKYYLSANCLKFIHVHFGPLDIYCPSKHRSETAYGLKRVCVCVNE